MSNKRPKSLPSRVIGDRNGYLAAKTFQEPAGRFVAVGVGSAASVAGSMEKTPAGKVPTWYVWG